MQFNDGALQRLTSHRKAMRELMCSPSPAVLLADTSGDPKAPSVHPDLTDRHWLIANLKILTPKRTT